MEMFTPLRLSTAGLSLVLSIEILPKDKTEQVIQPSVKPDHPLVPLRLVACILKESSFSNIQQLGSNGLNNSMEMFAPGIN
jgi:hypothetical protein